MSGIEPFLLAGAATAGTSTAAAGGAMSLFSALSTGFTLASAASSLFGGMQKAGMIKDQARQAAAALTMDAREDALDAKQETLRGKQETNNMLDTMIQTIASQDLAFVANGVDASFGTPASVQDSTRRLANLQMGVTRSDAQIRALARRRQGYARQEERLNVKANAGGKAGQAVMGGIASAGGAIGNLIDRRISRG